MLRPLHRSEAVIAVLSQGSKESQEGVIRLEVAVVAVGQNMSCQSATGLTPATLHSNLPTPGLEEVVPITAM